MSNSVLSPRNTRGQRILIVVLVLAVYFLSMGAPFILDDGPNILANESIRQFGDAFSAPLTTGLAARPLINLSLALNYAMSGYRVWSYHLLNMLVHAAAALLLMGVVRELLTTSRYRERYGNVAARIAFAAALLWALHPLCTAAVTYVIQRCESVYALMTLATLYCALRCWRDDGGATVWMILAIAACAAGMASKESALIIPIVVLLADCVRRRHAPWSAVRQCGWMYGGFALGAAWLAYRIKAVGIASAGGSADLVSPLAYATTQCHVVTHYLGLAVWPRSLCLDYAWPTEPLSAVIPFIVFIGVCVVATLWGLRRGHAAGLLATLAILSLAPSSSVFPIRDLAFEHRMYLPLAWLVAGAVVLVYDMAGRRMESASPRAALATLILVAALLGARTVKRNLDYVSEPGMWALVTTQRPLNHRAHGNLGVSLFLRGQVAEAEGPLRRSVELAPHYERGLAGLGAVLAELGRCEEAIPHLTAAIRINPANNTARARLERCAASLTRGEE